MTKSLMKLTWSIGYLFFIVYLNTHYFLIKLIASTFSLYGNSFHLFIGIICIDRIIMASEFSRFKFLGELSDEKQVVVVKIHHLSVRNTYVLGTNSIKIRSFISYWNLFLMRSEKFGKTPETFDKLTNSY